MVPHTRRRLLHVAAAGLAGLAGCTRLPGGSARSVESAPDDGVSSADVRAGSETDPPAVLLRTDAETPPIRFAPPDEEPPEHRPPDRVSGRASNRVVDSRKRRRRLAVDHPDGEEASAFLDATDFDTETVYLETRRVRECYRLTLCSVSWQPDRVATDYGRQLRPYDEPCSADAAVFETRLVRLPVPLDSDAVSTFASSIRRGRCRRALAGGSNGTDTSPPPSTPDGGETR